MTSNSKKSLITRHLKQSQICQRSQALYQNVIQRNFEIINGLLKKLDDIFTKHQDFQSQMVNYSKRLNKLQSDIQAIHNEHRRDNLYISSNMQDLRHQILSIDKQIMVMYDEIKRKGNLSTSINNYVIDKNQSLTEKYLPNSSNKIIPQQNQSNCTINQFDLSQKYSSNQYQYQSQQQQQHYHQDQDQHNQKIKQKQNLQQSKLKITNKMNKQLNVTQKDLNIRQDIQLFKQHKQKMKKKYRRSQKRKSQDLKLENKSNFYHSRISHDNQSILKSTRFQQRNNKNNINQNDKSRWNVLKQDDMQRVSLCQSQTIKYHPGLQQRLQNQKQLSSQPTPLNFVLNLSQSLGKNNNSNQKIKQNQQFIASLTQLFSSHHQIKQKIQILQHKLKQNQLRVSQIQINLKQFATNQNILTVSKQIHKLTQFCQQSYANKNETKKAIIFLQSKIRYISTNTTKSESVHRNRNLTNNIIKQLQQKGKQQIQTEQNSLLHKKSITNLKNRTIAILKQQKRRNISKYS